MTYTTNIRSGVTYENLFRYSSGLPSLDEKVGGSFRSGSSMEIYGKEKSGKTCLALSFLRAAEGKARTWYAPTDETVGRTFLMETVPSARHVRGTNQEDILEIILRLLSEPSPNVIVLDTIHGLIPHAYADTRVGTNMGGGRARMIYYFLQEAQRHLIRNPHLLIMTNQVRDNVYDKDTRPSLVSTMPPSSSPLLDYRIKLTRTNEHSEGGVVSYHKVEARPVLNRYSSRNETTDLWLWSTEGFWPAWNLFHHLLSTGILVRAGAYYKLTEGSEHQESLGPGAHKAAEAIENNFEFYKSLTN